ncbi:MAG: DUF4446 family protein [Anaerolineae bacterium]|nr:DUF4446 family protein [Anaerolineae bacterium]
MSSGGLAWWLSWAVGAVALVGLAVSVVLFSRRIARLERSLERLTSDTDGGSLKDILYDHIDRVRHSVAVAEEAQAQVRALMPTVRSSLQHRALLRFNAYDDVGGDQSLALVLADAHGDGVVLTCLHGRDGTRVYGKPLAGWISEYHLSSEEAQAVERARQSTES